MMTTKHGEPYFFFMGLLMAILVIAGFGTTLFTNTDAVLALPLIVHIHGAVFLSWFGLYLVQTRLIADGKLGLHRQMGQLSVVLALAMVVLGYLVTRGAYPKPEFSIAGLSSAGSTIFPTSDMIVFLAAYGLGLLNRPKAQAHKRFMLLAGLLILDPAVSRIVLFGLQAPPPLILLIEAGLILSLLAYDVIKLRRPHWASLTGLGLFVLMIALKMSQGESTWWLGTAKALYG